MRVVYRNGSDEVEVNVIDVISDDISRITYDEVVKLLKNNKFNDDKFGQIIGSYIGYEDSDPEWIYVDDINDEDEYEMFNDYDFYYIVLNTEGTTNLSITENGDIMSFNKFSKYIRG